MAALTQTHQAQIRQRLTIQTIDIDVNTTAIRSLDWDRDRFDIEFGLRNGTTYNSFLIQGEKTALIDTSHRKFEQLYLDALKGLIDLNTIDYLIVSHTEPDHSALVKDLLSLAPDIVIVGAKVALQFLENMVHQPFQSLRVKSGDRLDLGNGHMLEFVSAPNLHWPDTIFSYDHQTGILYTCDVFGMHYCDDHTYDQDSSLLKEDFRYYYDCLMGPNARSVLAALKRIDKLEIKLIATGHGPLLRYELPEWVESYRTWSLEQAKNNAFVVFFYCEDYGYSSHLVRSIAHGITRSGIQVELVDLEHTPHHELREWVAEAKGLVVGMPPQSSLAAQTALGIILAAAHQKQAIGLFEAGGGEDEPIYPLRNKFQEIGLKEAFPPIVIKEAPSAKIEKLCDEAGTDLGQWLTQDRTSKKTMASDTELEKALGRISSGLYLITATKGDVSSAMLASWITQASSSPLGVAIAVAKDRAIESLMQVGDRFVLNVLEENNHQAIMKHFLKRFPPGADRFAGIKTYAAKNNCPILADALAYMECEVSSRMDCGDHWIIYSIVETGRVANLDALTAVHHRKIGSQY
ncbi:flavin reductase domain protein FMN-binding protein (plasmid) [Thalassoporum mexicanum PCC 7367]|uniref:diflavin flavoprotein n=1 Tax=Thalassoporum mexicanum TaxID=3457544 RepID=UPI00029FCDFB|nr:diflavin flavoprotein [Pseudanabaena sp. PCC 7367]AFY72139.1 flavin reductase domain protein FMN-binding protein [Pseudanabaena sp. PCC 7367]